MKPLTFSAAIPKPVEVVCPACKGPGNPMNFNRLCDHCHRTRAILESRKAVRGRREKKREKMRAALSIAIPLLYVKAHLNQLPKKLQQIIREFGNLLFWGGVGIGKTHSAVAAMRHRISPDKSIMFVNWESFLIHLRDFDNGSEDRKLQELIIPDVLVLDDIGTSSSDYSTRALFVVIDQRMNKMKDTIITCNCNPGELEAMYGPRIASRLSTYKAIKLQGQDRRRQA